jgi:hypothetical protein
MFLLKLPLVCYVRVRRQSWFNNNYNSIDLLLRK